MEGNGAPFVSYRTQGIVPSAQYHALMIDVDAEERKRLDYFVCEERTDVDEKLVLYPSAGGSILPVSVGPTAAVVHRIGMVTQKARCLGPADSYVDGIYSSWTGGMRRGRLGRRCRLMVKVGGNELWSLVGAAVDDSKDCGSRNSKTLWALPGS